MNSVIITNVRLLIIPEEGQVTTPPLVMSPYHSRSLEVVVFKEGTHMTLKVGHRVPPPPPVTSPATTPRAPPPTTLGHATTPKKGTGEAFRDTC